MGREIPLCPRIQRYTTVGTHGHNESAVESEMSAILGQWFIAANGTAATGALNSKRTLRKGPKNDTGNKAADCGEAPSFRESSRKHHRGASPKMALSPAPDSP